MTRAGIYINVSNAPNEDFTLTLDEPTPHGEMIILGGEAVLQATVKPGEMVYLPSEEATLHMRPTGDDSGPYQGWQVFVYGEMEYSKTVLDNGDVHFVKMEPG